MITVDWLADAGRLRAFLAVAEHGGFTRAARALGVTQPTVSSLVAGLERAVGAQLISRARSGAGLTAAGAAFAPHARRMLAVADEARRAAAAAASGERRHLSVAGGEALVTYALPPALARLRERLPRLEVTLATADPAGAIAALRAGEVACVVAARGAVPTDLDFHPVGEDALVLIAPPGHPLRLDRLAGETLVVREEGRADRSELEALLRAAGVVPAGRVVVSGLEAVKRTVAAGLGLAVVPGISVAEDLASGRLGEVAVSGGLPTVAWGLAMPSSRDSHPLAAALLRELTAAR